MLKVKWNSNEIWVRAVALKIHKLLIFEKFQSKIDSFHRRLSLFCLASSERGSNFWMFCIIHMLWMLFFCHHPVTWLRPEMLVLLLLLLLLMVQHNQCLLSLSFGHTKSIFIGWHSRKNKQLLTGTPKRINIIFMNVEYVSFIFFSVYLCEKTHIHKPSIAHTILFHPNPSNTKDLAMRSNGNAKLCYVYPLARFMGLTNVHI